MIDLQLSHIEDAAKRLANTIHKTSLDKSTTFSDMTGGEIYLKFENQQKTGSFKIRGASNKIASLVEKGEIKCAVASSAGNHAQGTAYASKVHGIPSIICMPKSTPIAKVEATKGYGAKVVLHGDCYDDAYNKAIEIAKEEGATFIHPFDDLEVMAGQGTIGIEILEALPTVDTILVPAGGGGLLAGVAVCIKQINPRVKVIGVQAEGSPAVAKSFKEKKHVETENSVTIADGIAVKNPGINTIELINKYADDVVTVTDAEISSAILMLMERTKQLVEPAGATTLAAVLSGKVDVRDKKTVCVLSGGNIDVSFITRIIELGLSTRGRKIKFRTKLLDIPGSLGHLSKVLSSANANIIMVQYDRMSKDLDPNEVIIHIACEVGGTEHGKMVIDSLTKNGYDVILE